MTAAPPRPDREVRVRAPGKVNLSLRVGARREDGYHPVLTVFQAVSVYEDVVASADDEFRLTVSGPQADRVPTDESNLALRAARLLAARTGVDDGVHLHLHKGVPVAGGMAGGSADAAAALVACDAHWGTGQSREDLMALAAILGADVPFALMGHVAIGSGRGDLLTPALSRGEYHWVFAVRDAGLSTADVYATYDDIRPGGATLDPAADRALLQALRAGDPAALGEALHNDLQDATLELAPHLVETLSVAQDAGALGVVVSGSGPTVAALARSRQHAVMIAASLTAADVVDSVVTAVGSVPGARVLVGSSLDPTS